MASLRRSEVSPISTIWIESSPGCLATPGPAVGCARRNPRRLSQPSTIGEGRGTSFSRLSSGGVDLLSHRRDSLATSVSSRMVYQANDATDRRLGCQRASAYSPLLWGLRGGSVRRRSQLLPARPFRAVRRRAQATRPVRQRRRLVLREHEARGRWAADSSDAD